MTKFKYEEAVARLNEISTLLEGEVRDINLVAALVKESAVLIKQCKKQLRTTADEIEATLQNVDEPLT